MEEDKVRVYVSFDIQKTNRQWLESLSNKEVGLFLTSGLLVVTRGQENIFHYCVSVTDIMRRYTQSALGVEEWLSKPQEFEIWDGQGE